MNGMIYKYEIQMNMIKICTSYSLANYLTTFIMSSTHRQLSRELQSVIYKTDYLLMRFWWDSLLMSWESPLLSTLVGREDNTKHLKFDFCLSNLLICTAMQRFKSFVLPCDWVTEIICNIQIKVLGGTQPSCRKTNKL